MYVCMYLYACICMYVYVSMTATRLCQTADVKVKRSEERQQAQPPVCESVCVCGPCPLLPTSVFNICFTTLHYFFSSASCCCFYGRASCKTLLHIFQNVTAQVYTCISTHTNNAHIQLCVFCGTYELPLHRKRCRCLALANFYFTV